MKRTGPVKIVNSSEQVYLVRGYNPYLLPITDFIYKHVRLYVKLSNKNIGMHLYTGRTIGCKFEPQNDTYDLSSVSSQ